MSLITKGVTVVIVLFCSFVYGQMNQYTYKRELKGISDQWHDIILPNEIFGKITKELRDIRVFGITSSQDTIEAPFLLKLATDKTSNKDILFNLINSSFNENGFYYTFEVPSKELLNQIKLDFKKKNFDWRVVLEGSQNQSEWFTILTDYRLLSIKNDLSDYQFTKLSFPRSKYNYYRLFIKTKEDPMLETATITMSEFEAGELINYNIRRMEVEELSENKQTEITIELDMPVPVCFLNISVDYSFDYYRPITIKYLSDSIMTEKGMKYVYKTVYSGNLNSIEKNDFKFNSTRLQQLKVIIHNQDNQPLNIDAISLKGFVHKLVVRFPEQANYFLTYGNSKARKPLYDIDRFESTIPTELKTLEIGKEIAIEKLEESHIKSFDLKSIWLWITMGVIILVLGWFTLKMMNKVE